MKIRSAFCTTMPKKVFCICSLNWLLYCRYWSLCYQWCRFRIFKSHSSFKCLYMRVDAYDQPVWICLLFATEQSKTLECVRRLENVVGWPWLDVRYPQKPLYHSLPEQGRTGWLNITLDDEEGQVSFGILIYLLYCLNSALKHITFNTFNTLPLLRKFGSQRWVIHALHGFSTKLKFWNSLNSDRIK